MRVETWGLAPSREAVVVEVSLHQGLRLKKRPAVDA